MLQRVAFFTGHFREMLAINGWVDSDGLPLVAMLGVFTGGDPFAVIRINDMAGAAARCAIVAGLVVGAKIPGMRVIQASFVEVQNRDRDADAGSIAAV